MPYKRSNYLEWEEYFMSIAFLSAQRSKDPRTQVGACIVNRQNKIVGIGYNGMPIGCDDDEMPWNRSDDKSTDSWLNSKSPYVCHAELNAVLNKNLADVSDCRIYVALFPCNMCAQIIVQSGIKEVVFYSDKYHDTPAMIASRRLLDMAGVKYRQFRPSQKKVVIDFEVIESTPGLDGSVVLKKSGETIDSGTTADNSNSKGQDSVNNNNKGVDKTPSFDNRAAITTAFVPNNQQQTQQQQRLDRSATSVESGVWCFSNVVTSLLFVGVAVLCTWFGSLLPSLTTE